MNLEMTHEMEEMVPHNAEEIPHARTRAVATHCCAPLNMSSKNSYYVQIVTTKGDSCRRNFPLQYTSNHYSLLYCLKNEQYEQLLCPNSYNQREFLQKKFPTPVHEPSLFIVVLP
ncbi:hypothetical protein AVEN_198840-1 [Araneus ventricosus]|uniref:Uncharacterized protein n=1 Tax=Araneus ventricosus TaxID=182803 RepID=A0A4Y2JFW7_ARAVE|nr:hypothetical protein AVEN_198840-1 [Araneus ventricosus]